MWHYHTDYFDANQDFAIRAGLIDWDRWFTETELSVIRFNLSDYLTIDGGDYLIGEKELGDKGYIVRKIDNVVATGIHEQAREAEDQGYEPEQELLQAFAERLASYLSGRRYY